MMTTKTKNRLYDIGNGFLSQLYPDRCAICGELVGEKECVCEGCNNTFQRKPEKFFIGKTVCYSVCEYIEPNKSIVLGAKDGRDFYKQCFMATEIYALLKGFGAMDDVEVIVPTPISMVKRIKRGFNHTEKLARHLSFLSGIDTVTAVKKIKETAQQKTLSRKERFTNLKNCYAVNKRHIVRNKAVLLIDDVTTTGSTLREVADILQKNGNKVICAVFARTPYKDKNDTE